MPRYYCDYCDTYLTHDSPSVRQQHNAGYKHKANVRNYYQQFEEQQTQSLIDQKVKEHLGQTTAFQVGAAFHQHIAALQSGQYKPPISMPVLPTPTLPSPGSIPGGTATVRPPVLPRPTGLSPGYGMPPAVRPPTPIAEPNGFPRPPMLTPPGAPGVRLVNSFSTSTNGPVPSISTGSGAHQQQSAQSNGLYGDFPSVPGAPSASYTQHNLIAQTANSQHPLLRAGVPSGSPGQTNIFYGQNPTGPPGAS